MARKKELLQFFDHLKILYSDLRNIIVEYDVIIWVSSHQWNPSSDPSGLISDQFYLHICTPDNNSVSTHTLHGQILIPEEKQKETESSFSSLFKKKEKYSTNNRSNFLFSSRNRLLSKSFICCRR